MKLWRFGFLFLLLVCSARGEDKLNLFIWSEYLPPEVVSQFEARFHCKVVIDLYEDAESMLAKVQGGGASIYDIVVPPDYLVTAMIKQQLLAPLRMRELPNFKNLDPQFRDTPFDPGNKFTIPYQWGTVGVYARKAADGKTLDPTWGLLFDPAKQPGQIVLIDSMRDLIGAALKYQGASLNTTQLADLKKVRETLLAAKKRSTGFAGSVAGKNRVLDRSAAAAIVYSGEGARGMSEDKETYYFIPKEGSQIWLDSLAILAQAPHRELAEKFLNFILEPEIGAKISNYTQFSTPNHAARSLIKPELLKNPAIYPDEKTMSKLEFLKDLGKETRVYDQLWTQIKAE